MEKYKKIKHEIIDQLLYKRSTSALSKKMGYSFDKVKRWKNGTKKLRWNEFCNLCEATGAPLLESLLFVLGFSIERPEDVYKIFRHLRYFLPEKSNEKLAKKIEVSLSVLQRYLSSKTYPDLTLVLAMIDRRPGFLDSFIEMLIPLKKEQEEKSIFSIPWIGAVSNASALESHQALAEHSSAWIAQFLGLTISQVDQAIELMVSSGLLVKNGKHYNQTLSRTISLSRKMNPLEFAKFISFWIERSKARYQTPSGVPINKSSGPNCDVFRTFASSVEDAQKISEIIKKAERDIHELLQKSKDDLKTDVRVFIFQHFSAQDCV